jgi:hypothetical protein
MAMFSDLIKNVMEVFMDNFSIYDKAFEDCLAYLDKVLKTCQEVDLVLNREKCTSRFEKESSLDTKYQRRGLRWTRLRLRLLNNCRHPPM